MAATTAGDGQAWTMLDLARSALATVSMVGHPIPAANVDPVEAELAGRERSVRRSFRRASSHRSPRRSWHAAGASAGADASPNVAR